MTHAPRLSLPAVVDAVKALAHPGRLRILGMLREGDLCVCQVTAALELAASTVSAHLSDLRRAGFVTERRRGKWVHYHLVEGGALAALAGQALRLAQADDQLATDAQAARALRKIPLATFCRPGVESKASGVVPAPVASPAGRKRSAAGRRA